MKRKNRAEKRRRRAAVLAAGLILGLALCGCQRAEEEPARPAPAEPVREAGVPAAVPAAKPQETPAPEPVPEPAPPSALDLAFLEDYCFQWSMPGERKIYENRPFEARPSCFTALRDGQMEAQAVDFGALKALYGIPEEAEFQAASPDGANIAFRAVTGLTEPDANGVQIPAAYRYDAVVDGTPYRLETRLLWREWGRGDEIIKFDRDVRGCQLTRDYSEECTTYAHYDFATAIEYEQTETGPQRMPPEGAFDSLVCNGGRGYAYFVWGDPGTLRVVSMPDRSILFQESLGTDDVEVLSLTDREAVYWHRGEETIGVLALPSGETRTIPAPGADRVLLSGDGTLAVCHDWDRGVLAVYRLSDGASVELPAPEGLWLEKLWPKTALSAGLGDP